MNGTLEFPTGGDGNLTPALRELYRPPADEAYWDGLEARILARAGLDGTATAPAWWQVLGAWSRVGLVAAGLVALVAGAAALRHREADLQESWEMVLEGNPSIATPMTVAIPSPRDYRERERSLRDVLEY